MSDIVTFNAATWRNDGWGRVATETTRRLAEPVPSRKKLTMPRRHHFHGNGKGRRRHSWIIGGVATSTKIVIWTLSGMAAVTALGLFVLLNHQEMTVPARPPLPGGMRRVDVPYSSSGIFDSTLHPPDAASSSMHPSVRGRVDGLGGGSPGFFDDDATGRPGAGDDFGGASSGFFHREGAADREGDGWPLVAQRDRLGRRATWRDQDNNREGHDGQQGAGYGYMYDEKTTTQPPLPGGRDERETTTAEEANELAARAINDALFTGGVLAGGGGGGGKAKKKHSTPLSRKARSAAKGVGAPGSEEMTAKRAVGGGTGYANEAVKALPHRKASTHITRTADREVMAEQAVLEIINSRSENSGQQRRRKSQ